MKRDQSIRVEFSVFPTKLIELVELCLSSSGSMLAANNEAVLTSSSADHSPTSSSLCPSSYLTRLDLNNGFLSVFEVNVFKELLHISLVLRPGNDIAIKAYLASRLYYSLNEGSRLRLEVNALKQAIQDSNEEHRVLAASLAEARYSNRNHFACTLYLNLNHLL